MISHNEDLTLGDSYFKIPTLGKVIVIFDFITKVISNVNVRLIQ